MLTFEKHVYVMFVLSFIHKDVATYYYYVTLVDEIITSLVHEMI